MEFKQAKRREKILGMITLAVLVGLFVFTIVIDPQLKQHKNLTRDLHYLQITLTKMKSDLLVKDRINKIYSEIEPLIATSGTEQQQISAFTRQLSDIYSKLNVKIKTVKILPLANENFYKRLSVRIEMEGHVRDFLGFIEAIEKHSNPIRIEQFDLKAQESRDNLYVSMIITKVVSESKT